MARARNAANKGLPARWRLISGSYYYRPTGDTRHLWDGKEHFKLGRSLAEASTTWAKRMEATPAKVSTIAELLDRYALEVIPYKAVTSQGSDALWLVNLRKVFGHMRLVDIEPHQIYKYVDSRVGRQGQKIRSTARHEVGLLKHAYSKAVEWGLLNRHPFKGEVRLKGARPRKRYVADWEIAELKKLSTMRKSGSILMIRAYIELKGLTGLRRGDMLRLRMQDIDEDGIHVTPRKTAESSGSPRVYDWTPKLRAAVEQAKAARPNKRSRFLFCTKRGAGYFNEKSGRPEGWNSMWQRFMTRLLKETKITERFTEHDLRAKAGSDATSLERATDLLGHADTKITKRVYRRRAERVKPLR